MNTNYQYNQTLFPNEEYALISIIDADWQIEKYSAEIVFREKYPTDDIDYVFCGLLNQFGGTLPKYEFARLLGFSLEDIPEKNIYRDEAEEMVLDDLLKERELFGLIHVQKKNKKKGKDEEKNESVINPILTLTDEGRYSLNTKLKYRTWQGEFDYFKNYFDSKNPQFDFFKYFGLKSDSPNKSNIEENNWFTQRVNARSESETKLFCKIQDKTIYQLIDNQLDKASIGSFELCTIKSSLKKENKNQKIQYALCQSQEADNLLLVLQKEGVQEELTSIINNPENRNFKDDLVLRCNFKALIDNHSAIFDSYVVKEYLRLWNKQELIWDSRLKWSEDELWAIFNADFNVNEWNSISQIAPLKILKNKISEYNHRLNWATLSERFDDDYIYEHLYTEGYQWDFEILSSRNSDFVWLLITEINNYNSKREQEQQIVANWDFLIITDNLSEDRIKFLLPYKSQLDFIQLSQKQPEFVLACMNEISKINANSLDNNDHYRANWDWKFISENWNLETIWNNIDTLEGNLDWYVFIKRAFSDAQFSAYLLENVDFKAKLLKNKNKVIPTFRLENLMWCEPLIDLFNEVGILLWQSYSQDGFECNPSIEWIPLLFQKYAPFITSDKGKNHFSKSIKSWDYVFIAPDFDWDWVELSRNKHLNFDSPILQRFKNELHWTIISKRSDENFILEHLFDFDWDFTILSSEKNDSFIKAALSQDNGIAAKGWNWGILSERLDELFIINHLLDFNWDFSVFSTKKSEDFIKSALNTDNETNQKNWNWNILTERLDEHFISEHLLDFDWDFAVLSTKKSNDFIKNGLKQKSEVLAKNWNWKHLTKILDKAFIVQHLTIISEKWDWSHLTREKFSKDEIIKLCNDTVEYWDWSYLINTSFSVSEVTDEDFFILLAAYLNLIQNDELRKQYWSILTKKMPPEFFVQNDYENLRYTYDLVQWDWSYLSQHPRLDFTIDFIQEFIKKWDWEVLSKNKKINFDWTYLNKFSRFWDWKYLSEFSAFVLTRKELNRKTLDRFQRFIDFNAFSRRKDINIDNQLINDFGHKNWDFSILTSIKSLNPTQEFLRKYVDRNWDWQKLSERKDLKVEIKTDEDGKVIPEKFLNDLFLEFQDKDWNWQFLSKRKDIQFDFEFIEVFVDKNWDYQAIAKNSQTAWTTELIKFFIQNNIELDWNYISENNQALFSSLDRLESVKQFLNWDKLSNNSKIAITEDSLERFKDCWNWKIISENRDFELTENLIEKYKNRLFFPLLTKREDVLNNPFLFIRFKEENWDWDFISSEKFANKITEEVLTALSDKIVWSRLSSCGNLHLTQELLLKFKNYWDFVELYKQQNKFSKELLIVLQPFFENPKTQFLIKIDEQYSQWKGYIYHFTHLSNAVKIIKEMAIKSRNTANQINNSAGNVPDSSDKPKPYARFYFRPHTPAQFYNENLGKAPSDNYIKTKEWIYDGQRHSHTKYITEYSAAATMGYPKCPVPIFFKIDIKEVLDKYYYNCFISNGNMQSSWANIFTIQEGLNNFDFDNLYMDFDPSNVGLYKKASQQEFLVRNQLNISGLSSLEIICQCDEDKETLLNFIGNDHLLFDKIRVENYNTIYHFGNKRLNIEKTDNSLSVSTSFNGHGKTIIKTNRKNCIKEIEGEIYKVKPHIIEAGKNVKVTFSDEVGFQVCFIDESNQEWLLYGTNEFD